MIALRLIRAAVMAAAGAIVTLAQLNLPDRRFWEEQTLLQWASVVVLTFFIYYDAVRSVNYSVQAIRIRDYDNDLRSALSAAVSAVVLSTGAPWDEVAVHYYRRRRLLFWRWLIRVGAVLAGADVADARRSIRPDVGIVGTAFSTEMVIAEQWRQFVRTATKQGPRAWAQRDERDRFGLSWGQLRRSAQPEGIVASPTFAPNGQPDGCILLSGPFKLSDLTSDEIQRTLDDLATVLDRLGPPPTGWWGAHER
ncbi:hypothetical protein [Microbispora bryophytorum]|uniref:Uncharacterized protein n=1 Tax=Microbispora bryophytorum subsp. camponoti TaxID=1677852 RepID=A0ABR8KUL0_9ACTN|nr:hypothetical protein [Microbispora camponoti]MBD3142446.1 hypothetical protein [Microbispora camponoti]